MSSAQDIQDRCSDLRGLAHIGRGEVDADGFFSGVSKYVLLHYELMTVDEKNRDLDRAALHDVIAGVTKKLRGAELTGSVDVLPIPRDRTAERYAAQFWNALVKALEGQLRTGDSFYIHYSGRGLDRIGVIAQVVPAHLKTLSKVEIPDD